jgi:glycolate oxidase FAD binding subunit
MKNVAGYDVSRLMTGALGTLGIILEVSIKVMPRPEYETALTRKTDFNTALTSMNAWAGESLSLSAASYDDGQLNIRLSGKETAVASARKILAMEESGTGLDYWSQLREHQLAFFKDTKPLWRLSVPSTTGNMNLAGDWLIDWGGAQRWLKTDEPVDNIHRITEQAGGHATLFRGGDHDGVVFQPLKPALMQLHLRLKQVFDPVWILNRGRMYRDF